MKLIDLYRVTLTGLFICTLNARGEQGDPNDVEERVNDILSQMTLAEKVNYLAGAPPADPTLPNSTSENVPPVPRLGLPELRNCDGPMGIRVNGEPVPATRPTCSWPPPGIPSAPATKA
jgi:beta-glucosidase